MHMYVKQVVVLIYVAYICCIGRRTWPVPLGTAPKSTTYSAMMMPAAAVPKRAFAAACGSASPLTAAVPGRFACPEAIPAAGDPGVPGARGVFTGERRRRLGLSSAPPACGRGLPAGALGCRCASARGRRAIAPPGDAAPGSARAPAAPCSGRPAARVDAEAALALPAPAAAPAAPGVGPPAASLTPPAWAPLQVSAVTSIAGSRLTLPGPPACSPPPLPVPGSSCPPAAGPPAPPAACASAPTASARASPGAGVPGSGEARAGTAHDARPASALSSAARRRRSASASARQRAASGGVRAAGEGAALPPADPATDAGAAGLPEAAGQWSEHADGYNTFF
jgi:hypothetical protein